MTFFSALRFLIILPVSRRTREQASLSQSAAYFPLVGLVLGLILVAVDYGLRLDCPDLVASALLLALLTVLIGGLHFEGLVDACDGLFGGHTRERRLEIMRDKRVGAYAVAGGVLLLLVMWAAIASLTGPSRGWVLLLFPVLSRWGMTLAVGLFPYARQQGIGAAFRGTGPVQVAIAGATGLIAAVLLGAGGGLLLFAVATVIALLLGLGISRLLGGLTGDTYGAVNEVTEAVVLLVAVAVATHLAVLPLWQEWL